MDMSNLNNFPTGQVFPGSNVPLGGPGQQDYYSQFGIQAPGPFQQPTQGTGPNVRLPQGSNLTGLMNDPFGLTPPQGLGKYNSAHTGSVNIFGGPQDLMKSLATSSMGINLINQQYQQPTLQPGLTNALSNYAQSNPYLESMTQAYLPQLQTQGIQQQQANLGQLRDMLTNAYQLQGGLYGGQLQAVAQAKSIAKAKDAAKQAFLSAVVGGAVSGLTGNQYGEGNTSTGLMGAIG